MYDFGFLELGTRTLFLKWIVFCLSKHALQALLCWFQSSSVAVGVDVCMLRGNTFMVSQRSSSVSFEPSSIAHIPHLDRPDLSNETTWVHESTHSRLRGRNEIGLRICKYIGIEEQSMHT